MGLVDVTAGEHALIPIQGAQLVRLVLGAVIELSFAPPEIECTIGTEFEIEGNGVKWLGAPDAQPAPEWGPLTSLLWHAVQRLEVLVDAHLIIHFGNGFVIRIPPNDKYEAWSLAASDGSQAVCGPGGEISVWDPIFHATDASWLHRRG